MINKRSGLNLVEYRIKTGDLNYIHRPTTCIAQLQDVGLQSIEIVLNPFRNPQSRKLRVVETNNKKS